MAFAFLLPFPDVLFAAAGLYAVLGFLVPASIIAENTAHRKSSCLQSMCMRCEARHIESVCPECGSKAKKIIGFENISGGIAT
jgi:hypothetical protein